MPVIHAPKRWALLVGLAPLSIIVTALGFALVFVVDILGGFMILLGQAMNLLSIPGVLIGIWLDAKVVDENTNVTLTPWQWNIFALFFAPLVGTLYVYRRRSWFSP